MHSIVTFYSHQRFPKSQHVRVALGDYKRSTKAVALTHCIVTDISQNKTYYSVAICGQDQFSRKTGREIALKKAMDKSTRVELPFSLVATALPEGFEHPVYVEKTTETVWGELAPVLNELVKVSEK